MEINAAGDDGGTPQESAGLASSRSRRDRNPRAAKAGRFSALEALKVHIWASFNKSKSNLYIILPPYYISTIFITHYVFYLISGIERIR